MLTDVIQLVAYHRAMCVDRLRQLAEMGNDLVGRMQEVATREHGRPVHRDRLHYDHCGASPRALFIVGAVPFSGQAGFGHVRRMRAEYDAVAQGLVAQLQGLKKRGERLFHYGLM
jgi:hypothetical protein